MQNLRLKKNSLDKWTNLSPCFKTWLQDAVKQSAWIFVSTSGSCVIRFTNWLIIWLYWAVFDRWLLQRNNWSHHSPVLSNWFMLPITNTCTVKVPMCKCMMKHLNQEMTADAMLLNWKLSLIDRLSLMLFLTQKGHIRQFLSSWHITGEKDSESVYMMNLNKSLN